MSLHNDYENPKAVLNDSALSHDEKVNILMEWLDYEKQKMSAEAENMPSHEDKPHRLPEIMAALHELGVEIGD